MSRKSLRPRNIREYMASLATPPLTGPWGQKLVGLFGLGFDALVEATRLAVLARTTDPRLAPPDAQDARGADTLLPRFPGESHAAYGARLRNAWRTWQGAGSAKCIEEQLAAMGVVAKLRNARDPALPQRGETSWSRINVDVLSTPWKHTRRFGDGSIFGDGSTIGSTASRDEIAAMRHILETFREAHYVYDPISFSGVSSTVLALQPWSWLRADRYETQDGGVQSLVDIVDAAHALVYLPRGGSSVRAALPAPSATCNDRPALSLNPDGDTAAACGYRSNRSGAAWGFLRTGLYELWLVYRPRTVTGTQIYLTSGDGGNNRVWDYWRSGTVIKARNTPEVDGTLATAHGTDFRVTQVRGTANGGMVVGRATAAGTTSDTVAGHSSPLVDVSTGSPMTLALQSSSLLYPANMEFCELLVFNRALTATERDDAWAYVSARYGIPRGSL